MGKARGKKIFGFDRFPVKDKETLIFSIEKTNSKFIQGFAVGVFDGYTKTGETRTNKRKFCKYLFWEDAKGYDPKNIDIKIFTKGDLPEYSPPCHHLPADFRSYFYELFENFQSDKKESESYVGSLRALRNLRNVQ